MVGSVRAMGSTSLFVCDPAWATPPDRPKFAAIAILPQPCPEASSRLATMRALVQLDATEAALRRLDPGALADRTNFVLRVDDKSVLLDWYDAVWSRHVLLVPRLSDDAVNLGAVRRLALPEASIPPPQLAKLSSLRWLWLLGESSPEQSLLSLSGDPTSPADPSPRRYRELLDTIRASVPQLESLTLQIGGEMRTLFPREAILAELERQSAMDRRESGEPPTKLR